MQQHIVVDSDVGGRCRPPEAGGSFEQATLGRAPVREHLEREHLEREHLEREHLGDRNVTLNCYGKPGCYAS